MKPLTCFFLLISAAAGQIDQPVTPTRFHQDLEENQRKNKEVTTVLSGVKRYLEKDASDGDPQAQAAAVHADLMLCLANGDFRRTEEQLFRSAAAATAGVAEEWESRAAGQSSPPAQADSPLSAQVREIQARLQDLRARDVHTPEEATEIASLERREKLTTDALETYQRVRLRTSDPARITVAARQMRAIESALLKQADESRGESARHNLECQSAWVVLNDLSAQAQISAVVAGWGSVVAATVSPVGWTARAARNRATAGTAPAVENLERKVIQIETKVKRIEDTVNRNELILLDPVELRKRADHQSSLVNGGGN